MATKIKIKNIPTGYQSLISNGKHAIVGDEPIHSKGTDLGMSPPELVLAGIAMCKAATVRNVARRKGWEIGDVDAVLTQKVRRDKNSGQLSTSVEVAIKIDGNISEEQKEELLRESDNCYVNRMIMGEWDFAQAVDLEEEVLSS